MRRVALTFALAGLSGLSLPCACVSPSGHGIEFAGQKNVIVWDPETKIQHFIRIAGFTTDEPDLGFIAPTPDIPELAKVDEEVFSLASTVISQYEKALADANLLPSIGCGRSEDAPASEAVKDIEILREEDIGGYRATTLRARDAAGFRKWLTKNNFKTEQSIEKWIQFYMKKDWVFTAFLVKSRNGNAETSPVRMTFKTDRPYSPFYVPKANHPKNTADLAVAFYAPGVYKSIGVDAQSVRIALVRDAESKQLARHLKLANLPKNLAVSMSYYPMFPNPAASDDLFFHQTEKTPGWPVNLNPLKPYVLASIVGLFVVRAVRKRRQFPME